MSATATATTATGTEHFDVLILGAGLSGIGAGAHLTRDCPGKSFAILEARAASGGTWDLFRYPGIRSDSDMFTLGYAFKPWLGKKSIADGDSIREYIRETAREHDLDDHIRYHHKVVGGRWSSADARWTLDVERADTGETIQLTAAFILSCTGYYNYDEGFTPEFPGIERFGGTLIHPQHWPEDLDYAGKRIVVIGSGATAVTLIPSLAREAEHVTMLQRSPTYIVTLPDRDYIAEIGRKLLPAKTAYALARWKNVLVTQGFFVLCRRFPKLMARAIRTGVKLHLPRGFDADTHFKPKYNPWDQRVCLVPNGDLFRSLRKGKASVVTDGIETFTERGLKLTSGSELEADIIITATGLNVVAAGGLALTVDGREIKLAETVGYKGMMFSDIPNVVVTLGYTNASWTLKADLVAEHACRLLNYMDKHGYTKVTPRWPEAELPSDPIFDLMSGYVLRAIEHLPKQGPETPWRLHQNYARDIKMLRRGDVDDPALEFEGAGVEAAEPVAA